MNFILILSLLVTLIFNFIYPKLYGVSVGNISHKTKLDVTPHKFTFSIWGLIYLGLIILVFFKNNWTSKSIYLFVLSCILNSLWIIAWTKNPFNNNNIYIANMVLLLLTGCLLTLWSTNLRTNCNTLSYNVLFQNIIALYLAWCLSATLLNTAISLKTLDVSRDITNYFVIIGLCITHILWQYIGRNQSNSFMIDSMTFPFVGVLTLMGIFYNSSSWIDDKILAIIK